MIRDDHNVIPISMAVLLHVMLFGSMLVVFDFSRQMPITPLAIQATLVTEIPEVTPRVVAPEPEPVAEPEPEPEPPNRSLRNPSRSLITAQSYGVRQRKRSVGSMRW